MKKTFFILFLSLTFLSLIPNVSDAAVNEQSYCSELSAEDKKGGIVPCGRPCDDPTTQRDETRPCEFCHFFIMINGIVEFIMFRLVPVIAVLMLVFGGVMFLFAGAKPDMLIRAKGTITAAVVGIVIIFSAWIIVNTVLDKTGIIETDGWTWYNIDCPISGEE